MIKIDKRDPPSPDEATAWILGHSHIASLQMGWRVVGEEFAGSRCEFVQLGAEPYFDPVAAKSDSPAPFGVKGARIDRIERKLREQHPGRALTLLCIQGNQHNTIGFTTKSIGEDPEQALRRVSVVTRHYLATWLDLLDSLGIQNIALLSAPPPVQDNESILTNPAPVFADVFKNITELAMPQLRRNLWHRQQEATRDIALSRGHEFIELPDEVFGPEGFLAESCRLPGDATHGNLTYGKYVMRHVMRQLPGLLEKQARRIARHPYAGLPDRAYWKQAVAQIPGHCVDPSDRPACLIRASDKVATAGSCFAMHISGRLRDAGFNLMRMESDADAGAAPDAPPYDFSARYGNIYTARQLVQLFDRAFGFFSHRETHWRLPNGAFCDPFRPRVHGSGLPSAEAVVESARSHLAAVRSMFETLDVFIFTLGLTECFADRVSGAVLPLAPGVMGGDYDARRFEFLNFNASEVTADLHLFFRKLKEVNRRARLILTVSPVPLVVTGSGKHVLSATILSKSILRVAAHEFCSVTRDVQYFPSYEIVTGPHARGGYFDEDLRSVRPEAVDHVMRIFMERMTEQRPAIPAPELGPPSAFETRMTAAIQAACDEEIIQRSG